MFNRFGFYFQANSSCDHAIVSEVLPIISFFYLFLFKIKILIGFVTSFFVYPLVFMVEILYRNGKKRNMFILNARSIQKQKFRNFITIFLFIFSNVIMTLCMIYTVYKGEYIFMCLLETWVLRKGTYFFDTIKKLIKIISLLVN